MTKTTEKLTMDESLKVATVFLEENNSSKYYAENERNKEHLQIAKGLLNKAVDHWDYDSILEDIKTLEYKINRYSVESKSGKYSRMAFKKLEGSEAENLKKIHDEEMGKINQRLNELNKALDKCMDEFVKQASPLVDEFKQLERETLKTITVRSALPVGMNLEKYKGRATYSSGVAEQMYGISTVDKCIGTLKINLKRGEK